MNLHFPNRIAIYLSEATWIENKYQFLATFLYDVKSDRINRSVHYVHYSLEQKKQDIKRTLVENRTHGMINECDMHESDVNSSDANGRCNRL